MISKKCICDRIEKFYHNIKEKLLNRYKKIKGI